MSSDLFRQVVEARLSAPSSRLSALPVSILVHALVLAALVVIPLLASDILPIVRGTEILSVPVVLQPSPPVAPVARRVRRRDEFEALSLLQTSFIDEPTRAVEQADSLVAEIMQQLARTFAAERAHLEEQGEHGKDISTEDLRMALRHYRSFFDRLLSI